MVGHWIPKALSPSSCNPLLYGWRLKINPLIYFATISANVLALRIAHSLVRALAIVRGDFPDAKGWNTPTSTWTAFKLCFRGINDFKEHSDLWLPTAIGFFELWIYPILISTSRYAIIGGWIGIKTAGGWMGFTQSRTSFNRFLLFNIFTVIISTALSALIQPLNCQ